MSDTEPAGTATTLGEQILLLALDDTTGKAEQQPQAEYMISAAALLELALAGRIRIGDGKVVLQDATPLGAAALDAPLARIAGQDQQDDKGDAQKWVFGLRKEAYEAARQGLLDKGLIREEQRRVLGLFRTSRFPEADGSVEAALRRTLDQVVLAGRDPDERTAALLVLLHHGGLHASAFPDADQAAVKRRTAQIAESHWAGPAMQQLADSVLVALASFTTSTAVGIAFSNPS
ncbi:GPP34 family phosphoprotein [Streptomyces sp. NPDC001401]|uniref:GOLPH3/VPS74 family protein n=1 Tax=Streptomyces sp. NPDC001401 TaxID=3364570 RepID=UPI00367416A7